MQLRCWHCAGMADCIVQQMDAGPRQGHALMLQAGCTNVPQAVGPARVISTSPPGRVLAFVTNVSAFPDLVGANLDG